MHSLRKFVYYGLATGVSKKIPIISTELWWKSVQHDQVILQATRRLWSGEKLDFVGLPSEGNRIK